MAISPAFGTNPALHAYEAMASVYDNFTAHHDHEGWQADLLKLLERHGLAGRSLLDVACGTGKSFLPMLSRGWTVTACDISPAMLSVAERKSGDSVALSVADMRELPTLGEFDLVWALDDAINYLLSLDELENALRGMRENLAETGLLLFDANELLVYRTFYTETTVIERDGWRLTWRGLGSTSVGPGGMSESCFEAERIDRDMTGEPDGEVSLHRQRHFPEAEVLKALNRVGLECLGVYAHGLDGIPVQPLDTSVHTKAIYVARIAKNSNCEN